MIALRGYRVRNPVDLRLIWFDKIVEGDWDERDGTQNSVANLLAGFASQELKGATQNDRFSDSA